MDYSGVYKEEGFFIPLDYGHIVGLVWVAHEVVLIALANGYVVLVSAPLLMRQRKNAAAHVAGRSTDAEQPVAVTTKSMSTTRVFQNYLSACIELGASCGAGRQVQDLRSTCRSGGRGMGIVADIEIEGYDGRIGVPEHQCLPNIQDLRGHYLDWRPAAWLQPARCVADGQRRIM